MRSGFQDDQFGADPNSINSIAGSPLGLPAGHIDAKSVRLLLTNGAKVNFPDTDGWTPLMFACGGEGPSAEICTLLIKHGAEANAKDKGGWTSLMNAANYGNLSIVELLIQNGVDWEMVDGDGWTATKVAGKMGHHSIVNYLKRR